VRGPLVAQVRGTQMRALIVDAAPAAAAIRRITATRT
jgi:hypothetical protein